jgi:hypothetical protein
VGILPWDFWRMTPAELDERREGARRQDEREWERAAWMVRCILGAWTKTPPSVDQLLGRLIDA